MNKIKNEVYVFLTAVMFFTRIPVPKSLPYSPELLNSSTRYFSIIGAIIGGIAAGIFWCANLIFPIPITILLSIIGTILITGAFHEDGFADFCDGFGGGTSKDTILTIMKDSRLGTYATIGIISILSLKFFSLWYISIQTIPLVMIGAHICSRVLPTLVIHNLEYVQNSNQSKSKPVGQRSSIATPIVVCIVGIIPFIFMPLFAIYIIPTYIIIYIAFTKYITKKIGGYTGDVLGALQQISEVFFYIMFLVYQK